MPISFGGVAPPGGKTASIWLTDGLVTNTITEVGLFNDSLAGTMLVRRVMSLPVVMSYDSAYKIEFEVAVRDL